MNNDSQRWVSLIACMIASMCAGFAYAWSVFMKPLITMFHWSAADVSLSFTLIMSTAASTAIFAGKALEYVKPRQLLLFGGVLFGASIASLGYIQSLSQLYICAVLAGVGLGTVYPGATMTNTVRFFPDKRGMASGLLTAGYGSGPVVWAPVSAFLIGQYGILSALKILGVVFVVIIGVMSRLLKTAPEGYRPTGWVPPAASASAPIAEDKDWKAMIQTPAFYVLACMFILGTTSGMMAVGHASPIVQEVLKVTPKAASVVVGYLAVGMVFGKVLWGVISDKIGRYPVFVILNLLAGTAMVGMSTITSYIPFVLAISVTGLCYGGFLSLMAPVTADAFGPKYLGLNFGIMFLTIAIAAYVGPLLASVVKQANNGDYTKAFIIGAAINLAGLLLVGCFMLVRKRKALTEQKATALCAESSENI
ncbi:OFA family MFS transporter [Geobacter sp. AOG2]|uniref:L-lactate MFS transporter n=1 Tax=Geobacter sp. AOG2 TaxID=1566347 RepID=UPI001CC6FE05|nr:OFA family MFS transporter [Geobacter sp. AOG2]GFE59905.1 MFS transporter [Geobacter sp. AOG2]